MSAPAGKNQQARGKHHSTPGGQLRFNGKGRKSLEQYKLEQKLALDAFRKLAGG